MKGVIMNELININTDSYADLAKAMGIATEVSAKPKKSGNLNRLRIWHSPMMGQAEVNGKMANVEVIEGGSYRLEVVEESGSTFYYAKNISIRPFMQRFMLRRYIANLGAKAGEPKGMFHRTIMSDNLNGDLKDNTGRFNCGKPSGYIEDFKALAPDMQDLIRQIKRVRVIFGIVTLDEPTNEKGEAVALGDVPFIWEIDNKDAFKTLGEQFNSYVKKSRLPIQHLIHLNGTKANELPNGSHFYTPIAEVDFGESFDVTEADQKLFGDFIEWIKNFNDYICKEWEEKVETRQNPITPEEVETVESFIDIEGNN
tara:strand:- start:1785 stop:2723 length:939 start_codon:yes stop_codon:yes gene_type:complete